ncbi:MAG: hypothetical protein HY725_08780 [Candidatus Rokubacteria bacterium]|nr:hypothetical protein [Candidatus Rokubacteria bacterium]
MLAAKLWGGWGVTWDIQWHVLIGRDSFWIPPHLMTYSAVTAIVVAPETAAGLAVALIAGAFVGLIGHGLARVLGETRLARLEPLAPERPAGGSLRPA